MELGYFAMPSHPPECGLKEGHDWDLQVLRWLDEWWERWFAILAAILLAAGIGYSRIYLGAHYPSDVLAGYACGSVWLGTASNPGFILRVQPGPNPPSTCLTEIYNSPPGMSNPKGVFIDRATGVAWVGFAGTDNFASFDRRKCKVLNGPTATGDHCQEGWTFYPQPGPKFKNVNGAIGTDWYYLNWVDQFDTLGLGKNVPMAPGSNSDSLVALLPDTKQWVILRVPYPLGFFARGMDGRIDDPKGGWKGKGLWSNYASISPWNMEGGKGSVPKTVKFQLRPNPLAH